MRMVTISSSSSTKRMVSFPRGMAVAASETSRSSSCTRGKKTVNTEPLPTSELTSITPSWDTMMPCSTANPMPVPSPTSRVVKKGSKMRSSISGGMPLPVSLTVSTTYFPGIRSW